MDGVRPLPLEPPEILQEPLSFLMDALLEPWGLKVYSTDPTLTVSRISRARTWALHLEPDHPIQNLAARISPHDSSLVIVYRKDLAEAERLAACRAHNSPENPYAPDASLDGDSEADGDTLGTRDPGESGPH